MSTAAIAFGGNIGDVKSNYNAARELLESNGVHVVAASSLYETTPVGSETAQRYRNAALLVETSLSPLPCLHLLQSIEQQLGRVRQTHWGDRTVDLDLLLFGDEVCQTDELILPHPACWYRRFVLDPLCEIAPKAKHPIARKSVQDLQIGLLMRPLTCQFLGAVLETRVALVAHVKRTFGDVVHVLADDAPNSILPFSFPSPNVSIELPALSVVVEVGTEQNVEKNGSTKNPLEENVMTNFCSVVEYALTAALDEPHRLA
ncbi:MAG: 2-amino-4-hydroxy-6-hydroxymethyldihydropteridine diphosphokinase [Planctomycetaceae bacterium]